jgi:starch phosphorylase
MHESSIKSDSPSDRETLRRMLSDCFVSVLGKDPILGDNRDWLVTLSHVVRDGLAKRLVETRRHQRAPGMRHVNYLSMEFLLGRILINNLLALDLGDEYRAALHELGITLEDLRELEPEPGLGNGGLGRLAACFLDSLATLRLPAFGYGIRYQYGTFVQLIRDGHQTEHPDDWLAVGNPWEFPRPELAYTVRFGGRVERQDGVARWLGTDDILAVAYDTIIPGYATRAVTTLRLWSAEPVRGLDVSLFNIGEHARAIEHKVRARNLSRMLYPDDSTASGRELRLRQEYFLVSATLQDVLRRQLSEQGGLGSLAARAAIHLNDTHPALAVPELMRLLMDVHGWSWNDAWEACGRMFSYTNHTLMPEALETWPVDLLGALLPRHLEIIYELNARFLDEAEGRRAGHGDDGLSRRVSLIDELGERRVRMAHLCVLASSKVNGVSRLHTELMRQTVFADFATLFPGRIVNKTNGVTPRRWLGLANPALTRLIDERIGPGWRTDLERLSLLRPLAADVAFREDFRAAKAANKRRLIDLIRRETGALVDPDSLFDVQIKRIHEYKRQLLNVLHVVTRYNRIIADTATDWLPRTVIFAGKAASAYRMAKLIIKLIHDVAQRINDDPRVRDRLKVIFLPKLPSLARGDRDSRGRPLPADLDRRYRSIRHGQYEAGTQRRADARHRGRRQHRDPRPSRAGEHLSLRALGRGLKTASRERLRPEPNLPIRPGAEPGARPNRLRPLLAGRARPLPPHRGCVAAPGRPLLPHGRLCLLHGRPRARRRALSKRAGVGARGRAQRCRHGDVLQRPRRRGICRGNLAAAPHRNLTHLVVARNWQLAFRDEALACGAIIPDTK